MFNVIITVNFKLLKEEHEAYKKNLVSVAYLSYPLLKDLAHKIKCKSSNKLNLVITSALPKIFNYKVYNYK